MAKLKCSQKKKKSLPWWRTQLSTQKSGNGRACSLDCFWGNKGSSHWKHRNKQPKAQVTSSIRNTCLIMKAATWTHSHIHWRKNHLRTKLCSNLWRREAPTSFRRYKSSSIWKCLWKGLTNTHNNHQRNNTRLNWDNSTKIWNFNKRLTRNFPYQMTIWTNRSVSLRHWIKWAA